MSDREGSRSPSQSPHKSTSAKRSNSAKRSRSASKSRSRSHSRRRKDSRSSRRGYQSRSRSRSYDRRRYSKHDGYERSSRSSRQRSGSRSPMSSRRRHAGDRASNRNNSSRLNGATDMDHPRKSRCLGIFGLSLRTQERDIREIFEQYGPIDNLQIVYDHQTGRSRGFGFIYMKYIEDAIEAKEKAAGTQLDGRNIRVDFSITERAHTPTPGVYLGSTSAGASRYGHRSPSPYKRGGGRYSRSPSRSRSNSRRRY